MIFNLRFVAEVEKYPELYNYTLAAYSKKDAVDKAWNQVGKEVNLSVNECKERWRNLRSTLAKHLKPKLNGNGVPRKKPYYLMEAMQFTIPFVKVGGNPTDNLSALQIMPSTPPSTQSIYEASNPEEEYQNFKEEEYQNFKEEEYQDFKGEMIDDTSINSPPLISPPFASSCQGGRIGTPSSETSSGIIRHSQPSKKRGLTPSAEVDKAFAAYFSAKQANLSITPSPKDEGDKREEGIKYFLLSLLPDLTKLNDVQLRSFKRKTLLLIDEVVCGDS